MRNTFLLTILIVTMFLPQNIYACTSAIVTGDIRKWYDNNEDEKRNNKKY